MRMPHVHGTIKRRLLINYRVAPAVIRPMLPAPFQPKLHHGSAIAGLCLIRLEGIRPGRFPQLAGLSSENAAHRIAVTWKDENGAHEGVFIPRRDTGSIVNHLAGGRLFPGEQHRATFRVLEDTSRIELHMRSADGQFDIDVIGQPSARLCGGSSFATLDEASAFFERGEMGYSATASGRHFDGIALHTASWKVAPFDVEYARSSYFTDSSRFPEGSIELDCGLIMRDIQHEWSPMPEIRATLESTLEPPAQSGAG